MRQFLNNNFETGSVNRRNIGATKVCFFVEICLPYTAEIIKALCDRVQLVMRLLKERMCVMWIMSSDSQVCLNGYFCRQELRRVSF